MKRVMRKITIVFAVAACAHAPTSKLRPPPGATRERAAYVFPPMEIKAGPPEQIAIADLNEQELMAGGTAAFAAEDFKKAATYFDRLSDSFPGSDKHVPALYNAGLAHARLAQYVEAQARFQAVADADKDAKGVVGQDGVDALFRVAECQYSLGRFTDAAATLAPLIDRADLTPARRADAATKRGICLFQGKDLASAEAQLREALRRYKEELGDEADEYGVSQAQFYLAEVFRSYFEQLTLSPDNATEKQLTDQLESKAEMLLSAQGHYLRCMRLGDPEWTTASGYRIGELYENFHAALTTAPVPKDLDEEQTAAYRDELKRRVRILITKSIEVYEKTLAAAQRVNATNPFIEKTRASLDRLKDFLLKEETAADSKKAPT